MTFACKLDAAAYAPCTSPVAARALAPASTSSRCAARPGGQRRQPARVAWTYTPPDTTPPTVTITAAPPASTTATEAAFSFVSSEPGVDVRVLARRRMRSPPARALSRTSASRPAPTRSPCAPPTRPETRARPEPHVDDRAAAARPLRQRVLAFSITISNQGTATAGAVDADDHARSARSRCRASRPAARPRSRGRSAASAPTARSSTAQGRHRVGRDEQHRHTAEHVRRVTSLSTGKRAAK